MNSARKRPRAGQLGYSLVEMTVALAILIPLLGSVIASKRLLSNDLSAQSGAASCAEAIRTLSHRITVLARSAYLTTCATRATAADVAAATAANASDPSVVIPALGDWVSVPQNSARTSLRFRSAEGVLSLNAQTLTAPREIEFVMDPGEADNDADDDQDGLVDEGRVLLRLGATPLLLSSGVERCTFRLDGRALVLDLAAAQRDAHNRVFRSHTVQQVYMRNN